MIPSSASRATRYVSTGPFYVSKQSRSLLSSYRKEFPSTAKQVELWKNKSLFHSYRASQGRATLAFTDGCCYQQHRYFFFGSGSSGDDDDDDKKNNQDKEKGKGKEAKDKNNGEQSNENETKAPGPSDDHEKKEESKENQSTRANYFSKGSTTHNNIWLPASRLGFGDQAPRYPHLMALPLVRTVFPGVPTHVTVTDPVSPNKILNDILFAMEIQCQHSCIFAMNLLLTLSCQSISVFLLENYSSFGESCFWRIWWLSGTVPSKRPFQ